MAKPAKAKTKPAATGTRQPRPPQQARSRATVDRLVNAADEILATEGYEALTVRRIADVATVPVGSIYQFFQDKNAIIDVVARRYLERFARVMEDLVAQAADLAWTDLSDTVLDAFIAMYRENPGYLAIWLGRHLSDELLREDEANNELLAGGLRLILIAQEGLEDTEELAHVCRVAVSIGDALLQLSFRAAPGGDPVFITEAKRIERLYLEDVVQRLRPGG